MGDNGRTVSRSGSRSGSRAGSRLSSRPSSRGGQNYPGSNSDVTYTPLTTGGEGEESGREPPAISLDLDLLPSAFALAPPSGAVSPVLAQGTAGSAEAEAEQGGSGRGARTIPHTPVRRVRKSVPLAAPALQPPSSVTAVGVRVTPVPSPLEWEAVAAGVAQNTQNTQNSPLLPPSGLSPGDSPARSQDTGSGDSDGGLDTYNEQATPLPMLTTTTTTTPHSRCLPSLLPFDIVGSFPHFPLLPSPRPLSDTTFFVSATYSPPPLPLLPLPLP